MPQYEEINIQELHTFDARAFQAFEDECKQDSEAELRKLDTRHIQFSGQV